jgi:peptide deformylase
MTTIVQQENPVLRHTALPVAPAEFGTTALSHLVEKMSVALSQCDDGVALAAPQIGVAKRIFIVSRKIFEENPPDQDLVFINPRITKTSRRRALVEEGCLSVRWWYGKVKRAEKVTVEAYDLAGQKFTRHGEGLLAQIFQHEIDHLDGVLFIDKAQDLEELPPENHHHPKG